MNTSVHLIKISPSDPLNSIERISKKIATNTEWWYVLPNESEPRRIVRFGYLWKCQLPTYRGLQVYMETYVDDDFHRLLSDIKLCNATIYNKINRR